MKLFKSNHASSEADRAAGLRLENIASRYRALSEPNEDDSPVSGDETRDSTEPPQ